MSSKYISFLAPHIESFIAFRIARNQWCAFDERMILSFDRFCATEHPTATELTQEIVDGWCSWRPTEKASSCVSRTGPVRFLVQWMNDRGLTQVVPTLTPKPGHRTAAPYAFSEDQLCAFFTACDKLEYLGSDLDVKLKKIIIPVIFRLLYSTGMRPPEARLLQCSNVNLPEGIISIQNSKGPDQHFVVLHDSMAALLKRYDAAVTKIMPDRKWFFPDPDDKPHNSMWLWRMFQRAAAQCGIEGASPYDFRHNYAITNINSWIGLGFDFDDKLVYLSKSMGHRMLQSTLWYYSVVPALSDVLQELTEAGQMDIIPEVYHEEE